MKYIQYSQGTTPFSTICGAMARWLDQWVINNGSSVSWTRFPLASVVTAASHNADVQW